LAVIDSHCHLADKAFAGDLSEVLLRAEEHGIEAMVTIGDSLEESRRCIELSESHEPVFCSVGVHPHNAKDWRDGDGQRLRLLAQSSSKVKAIGEIGLDYHYDHSPRDVQRRVFREQLAIAKELCLPAVIHCREAINDVREILEEIWPILCVIHCCTEAWSDVQTLVTRGAFLGFTGIATYPKAGAIRETIAACPMERMFIETDAPYLAPVPHRGKRCEPAFVRDTAACIAGIKRIPLTEVDRITAGNTVAFFRLSPYDSRHVRL